MIFFSFINKIPKLFIIQFEYHDQPNNAVGVTQFALNKS